jgi:hypothetical protein
MRADPILMYLDDLEGLNYWYLHRGRGPQVRELANGLRHHTVVPSQDLSGAWVTIQG